MATTDDYKVDLLYASINDIQGTIRAIDTKIGLLFLAQLFPLANLGSIRTHLANICPQNTSFTTICLYQVFLFFFIGLWVLSMIASLKAIIAVDDPAKHISTDDHHSASFYRPNLYNLSFIDAFLNRKSILAKSSIEKLVYLLPKDITFLIKDLTFEQMKLVYIREIKIIRQKWAFRLAIIWMSIGFLCYLYSVLK